MATAAPHVKLLRQLASAKDDYLSGAFDISWDGAKATLYLVFGRPSHAVFDTDQAQIEGEAAIDALLAELPRTFVVSDWRRAMSPHETLSISIDELAGPFVRLAGSYADDPISEESPEWWSADDSSPDLAFGLGDFPLLPGGRPLWAETSPENVNLAERLAELPPSILILTSAKLRAAAVVSGGDLIDAVWIDDEDHARGEAAGMAILGATKGSLAGYALDDPRVADALTMLWRLPVAVSGIDMSWLDPASMLAAFRADGLDRVLVIDAPVRGIALFSRGGLVAVYSETQRSAVASPERLRSLLSQARGRLTVMERKPRQAGAAAAQAGPSATDFFGVVAPEAPADVAPEAGAAPEVAADGQVDEGFASPGEPAGAAGAEAATETEAETGVAEEDEPDTATAAESATAETVAAAAPEAQTEAGSAGDEPVDGDAVAGEQGQPPAAEGEADTTAGYEFEPATAPAADERDEAAEIPPPPPDAELTAPATDTGIAASTEHAPPAWESGIAASVEHSPPPPMPEAGIQSEPKPKRRWWAFGGSRRNKSGATAASTPETTAAEAATAHGAAEAAEFAGWSVRQPGPETQPVWYRSRDHAEGSGGSLTGTEGPPPAAEAVTDAPAHEHEPEAAAHPPTWSVVEPGSLTPRAASWPSSPPGPPAEETGEPEAPADTQPDNATTPAWSTRDVPADAVGWNHPVEPHHPESAAAGADDAPGAAAEGEGAHDDTREDAHAQTHAATDEATHRETEDATHGDTDQAVHADADEAAHADAIEVAHGESGDAAPAETFEAAHADTGEAPTDGDGEHVVAAEVDQSLAVWFHPVQANPDYHDAAVTDAHEPGDTGDAEPVAATGDEHADATEHDPSAAAEPSHDFWAEFASPDPDAEAAGSVAAEPEVADVTHTEADSADEPAVAPEPEAADEPAAANEPAAADHADVFPRRPSERTVAPWSWPLAESEPVAAPAAHSDASGHIDETPEPADALAHNDSGSDDWAPVFGSDQAAGDQSFFQRDEPVGSQFVDFDEVRTELVQIGIVWLGEANAVPVTALLRETRSTIDDFVATIDTIRGLHLEGQDPASVQAMAREMHQQAAERLCGA
ncbi:MAG TPA: hypothetical protein VND88_13725 [Candidatus Acidoferrales bacterium]|nr:hypothetical protein [Candidatus Acidoferrales bacterium]